MYTPNSFRLEDQAPAFALIDDWPFATLLTQSAGDLQISHLPVLRDGAMLRGHLARANPHCAVLETGQSTLIFQGPHAYVSPNWYAEGAPPIPTWNYAVVHVRGAVQLLDDEQTATLLAELTAEFDNGDIAGLNEDVLRPSLKAIVGFEMCTETLDAKFKMSQNRRAADRAGVVSELAGMASTVDQAVGQWMATHLDCGSDREHT